MIFETVKSEGLAHYSYVVGDQEKGICAVIDPRRDVDVYVEIAHRYQARIDMILETHIHADFVSGSCELAALTGAPIGVGAEGAYSFDHRPLTDGDILPFGSLQLEVLHTPGHTREHICFLVSGGQKADAPWGLFSGDTLFAGDVGRPDIPQKQPVEEMSRLLFRSLHEKILPLGDEIVIFPAHGEGSPCGGSIGDRSISTIGYERRHNPLLRHEEPERFTRELLASLPPVPAYYPHLKEVNAAGPAVLGTSAPLIPALGADAFARAMETPGVVVLDLREIIAFGGGHIPGTINIALRQAFPIWAGRLLAKELPPRGDRSQDARVPILLVLPDEQDLDLARRELQRVGHDQIIGYLRHGLRGWTEAARRTATLPQKSVHELHEHILAEDGIQIVDVRSPHEWQEGHIPTARHIYVAELEDSMNQLDPDKPVITYCGSGYRASMAASLLKRSGFRRVYNVPGSITAWKEAGYPLEEP